MSFLESLNWRYATKRMNGKKVPQEKVDIILEAARLAPSASGLQPFQIISITDPALLEKIKSKQLPDTTAKDEVSGYLLFPLEGKHKLKNMAVLYRGPGGRLDIEFEH